MAGVVKRDDGYTYNNAVDAKQLKAFFLQEGDKAADGQQGNYKRYYITYNKQFNLVAGK